MCLKYAELERNLGEIDRARAIFVFSSNYADPRSDPDFWKKWKDFEIQHGNEDTFREMLRISRSVTASYSQVGLKYFWKVMLIGVKMERRISDVHADMDTDTVLNINYQYPNGR